MPNLDTASIDAQNQGAPRSHSRRDLLRTLAVGLPAVLLLAPALSPAAARSPRTLSFYHTHTGERCSVLYFDEGRYLEDGLAELNRFLRDFRTGEVHPIDPILLRSSGGVWLSLWPDSAWPRQRYLRRPECCHRRGLLFSKHR